MLHQICTFCSWLALILNKESSTILCYKMYTNIGVNTDLYNLTLKKSLKQWKKTPQKTTCSNGIKREISFHIPKICIPKGILSWWEEFSTEWVVSSTLHALQSTICVTNMYNEGASWNALYSNNVMFYVTLCVNVSWFLPQH